MTLWGVFVVIYGASAFVLFTAGVAYQVKVMKSLTVGDLLCMLFMSAIPAINTIGAITITGDLIGKTGFMDKVLYRGKD